MNNIAVILVTFNRSDMLKQNLNSLKEQGSLTYFIIDNNSSDNTELIVKEFSNSISDNVYYYNMQANLGGAGGFAYGCEKALADNENFTHLWLSDDDVIFHIDCLKQLNPHIDQRTILQPMRYSIDSRNAEASATVIDLDTICILNHKRNSVMGTEFENAIKPFDIQNIPFEGPLIPRSVFEKIGIPDARYFIFSDDLDFSLRALRNDFEIKCIPNAKMTRLRPSEPNYKPTDWKSYFVYRNFFRIHKEFGNNWFVQHRPYLLALLIIVYCFFTGNWEGIIIVFNALNDGMSSEFKINDKYIP
ncbi:glycosyltransferase [Aliivibrio fischeri]|uniref:glycosyltransferase n=1 Tax=Aliivibrio fischeri TaxID=668 RepID=UPI0012DAA606|nr:glycosyltransferase [Aliivibrio fischeri]MUJ28012.1 glycosyltransferase [Aliivibrio fischeri]